MDCLRKATIDDLPGVLKLFGRTVTSFEAEGNDVYSHGYPTEKHFVDDVSDGHAYIIKDKGRVVAYISYDRDIKGSFFPASEGESKVYQLLDDVGYKGEGGYIVLHRLMVDPSYRKHGYGRQLMSFISDRFKGNLLLFCVYNKSLGAIRFYNRLRFKTLGIYPFDWGNDYEEEEYLFYKYV